MWPPSPPSSYTAVFGAPFFFVKKIYPKKIIISPSAKKKVNFFFAPAALYRCDPGGCAIEFLSLGSRYRGLYGSPLQKHDSGKVSGTQTMYKPNLEKSAAPQADGPAGETPALFSKIGDSMV